MKNKLLWLAIFCCAMYSCNNETDKSGISEKVLPAIASDYNYSKLQGTYRGDFGGSNISLVLRYVTGTHAVGYNILKGLRRNISGVAEPTTNGFRFRLSEPGDNPHDGVFSFTLDTAAQVIAGNWEPLQKGSPTRQYTLKRYWNDTAALEMGENIYGDSLGTFEFGPEGLCTYQSYPGAASQLVEVHGNWTLKDSSYIIDWQPNSLLPRRTIFRRKQKKIDVGDSGAAYYETELRGEGRILTPTEL